MLSCVWSKETYFGISQNDWYLFRIFWKIWWWEQFKCLVLCKIRLMRDASKDRERNALVLNEKKLRHGWDASLKWLEFSELDFDFIKQCGWGVVQIRDKIQMRGWRREFWLDFSCHLLILLCLFKHKSSHVGAWFRHLLIKVGRFFLFLCFFLCCHLLVRTFSDNNNN